MKHSANLLVNSPSGIVGDVLADLATYPRWNDLVQDASPVEVPDGELSAWTTTLRAQIGPLARSKQLRFVRTVDDVADDGSRRVRFERQEVDRREHAEWVMETTVRPRDAKQSVVTLELCYGGGLWVPALEGALGTAIERATSRLASYVASLP